MTAGTQPIHKTVVSSSSCHMHISSCVQCFASCDLRHDPLQHFTGIILTPGRDSTTCHSASTPKNILRWSSGRVATSLIVNVENWNHIPETCECRRLWPDAAGSRHKAVNLKNSQIVRWQSVLSADPWWMLAQTSCCTRLLVAGRSWSRHRQRAQGRFVDVARVPVTKQFR